MKVEILRNEQPQGINGTSLPYGTIGIVQNLDSPYKGRIVLRTYNGFVSLNDPSETWGDAGVFRVEPLPKGSQVKLTVE